MLCIGLTGGIGTGKSAVSIMLKERSIPVIDADIISRNILGVYPEIADIIKKKFGHEFFSEDGKLNRRKLGDFVFRFPEERGKLETIMIPYIKKEIKKHIDFYRSLNETMCIVDAPILIETGIYNDMDFNILIWTSEEIQIKRVMDRDKFNIEQVMDRINSQMPLDKKKDYVDFIIDNSFQLENTEKQLENILELLTAQ
ncbi:dephospho-CoA kinase [Clostridium akagii]|uniref:dephospho-CoA kinase n=1 Tax=Clostridium akagii TaxID=91623 RepID=UPI00047A98C1|nr:dephospho-CoA kinase [Clostridium akagii]